MTPVRLEPAALVVHAVAHAFVCARRHQWVYMSVCYVHTCMYEYVYACMNVRMTRAYDRAGAHALVYPSVCLSDCLYICMYVYMLVCAFLYMHACACVRLSVCLYVCPLLFF